MAGAYHGRPMDDKQLLALARKNAAKSTTKPKPRRSYDPTVDATRGTAPEDEGDALQLFREMKRREF